MIEDAEDAGPFEEGEIQERFYSQPGQHQPRSQSQSFLAPRFAALAAQQEQDTVGPTGRPQLAPGFMFGARKRTGPPLGPPINEEDINFQFPQQGQGFTPEISQQGQAHKRSDSGEITGIMAEQVDFNLANFLSPSKYMLDLSPESDRGFAATTTGLVSTTACIQSGPFLPDAWSCIEPSYHTQTGAKHPAGIGHNLRF
jgi:hypothetical protein